MKRRAQANEHTPAPAKLPPPPLRKRGRPSKYTPEVAERICDLLTMGMSLKEACRTYDELPDEATVRTWVRDDVGGFFTPYTRARAAGMDAYVDHARDVATDTARDPNCRRVEIDTIKWIACKLAPKLYGDTREESATSLNVQVICLPSLPGQPAPRQLAPADIELIPDSQ